MASFLTPVLIVGGIGLLAGVILAVASIVMAVPKDEKAEALEEILPGANCGACGFSGCSGYAKAMAEGTAQPGLCSPGGAAVAGQCAALLGSGNVETVSKTAVVRCLGSDDNTGSRMIYQGLASCGAVQLLGGQTDCRFGCLGLGDCVAACDFGAIRVCNGVAQADPEKCVGCGKCAAACPRKLIDLVPKRSRATVQCMNCDKAKDTMQACKAGCIGCGKCQRLCPAGAVTVTNGCAAVDPEKCTGCGACADACPRHIITLSAG